MAVRAVPIATSGVFLKPRMALLEWRKLSSKSSHFWGKLVLADPSGFETKYER
jgi:hypothetical protein